MNRIRIFLLFISCLFLPAPSIWAENVTIRDGRMSVDLKEAPLLDIAKDIENQAGISFRGDESLLEETVSVSFKDLPLEEGIRRILANLNYSFMFDKQGKIATVMIMSQGSGSSVSPRQVSAAPVRPRSPTPQRRPVVRRTRPFSSPLVTGRTRTPATPRPRSLPPRSRSQSATAQGGPARFAPSGESNLPDAFRTIENAPAPGGPIEPDASLPPAFRALPNAESPGGVVKSKETPQTIKVQKHVPPSAGSVESSREKPADEHAPK
jgi:hypothetical protein